MKLSEFQLYCILLILVAPVAYLELPHTLVHILFTNAWIAVLASLIPGLLLIQMYSYIINKSTQPFPLMLNEHFGKYFGWILGFLYIPGFILMCSYTLRLFIEFMKMVVFPATPISVFIGVALLVCLVAIKIGLDSLARVLEIVTLVGVAFGIAIILVALANAFHINRILPIGYMSYKAFGQATLTSAAILGKMMPVLSLAFFIDYPKQSIIIMRKVTITYVLLISFITMAVVMTRGIMPALSLTFPVFSMVRLARIGSFIQNLDIFFIGLWILGIFGSVAVPWFMVCYTTQKVFNLSDYRFVAAPTTMIIGVLSILISENNLGVVIWSQRIIPIIYTIFFIGIPFFIFLITLFKPVPLNTAPEPSPTEEKAAA